MLEEKQKTVKIKTLLMKCFIAEGDFAIFLMRTADKCGSSLQLDDLLHLKDMSERIGRMLAEIESSDEKCRDDSNDKRPPDKLPVYP